MAKRKRNARSDETAGARRHVPADEKIARLLGMLLVKDIKKKTDQVPLLRSAGFEVSEVADMLGMTENHVKVADHLGRKKRRSG
jgi:DNA-directed RNA polymerase specialized sigma24 family protein